MTEIRNSHELAVIGSEISETSEVSVSSAVLAFALALILLFSFDQTALASGIDYQAEADSLRVVYEGAESASGELAPLASDATLSELLRFAALHNSGLKAAYYNWVSKTERAGIVGALPEPKLSYGRFIETVETRVGPQEQKFSLRQSLPWPGSLGAHKNASQEQANAAYQNYRFQKLILFDRVRRVYSDLYYLGRQIQLTRDNVTLLTLWESVARTKYSAGLRSYADLLKAQVELGMLEDNLNTLEARIEPVSARLRVALNADRGAKFDPPSDITVIEKPANSETAQSQALLKNPSLGAYAHQIQSKEAARSLAGKSSYPNFTFGVDYIETGEALNPALDGSGKDPLIVSVGLSLPIWFGKNSAKKAEADANLRKAEYALEDKQQRISQRVDEALFAHGDALRKIKLYRDGLIPKAEQALSAVFTAYESGEADFLSLIDSQRLLLKFQLQYDLALSDLAKAQSALAVLTGNEEELLN